MTIYLGGKYVVSYHILDLVGAAANIQNPTVYMQTLLNKATAYYNLIPTDYFLLEWIQQLAQNSYIYTELAKCCCVLPIY